MAILSARPAWFFSFVIGLLVFTGCAGPGSPGDADARDSARIMGSSREAHSALDSGNTAAALEHFKTGLDRSRTVGNGLLEGIGLANISSVYGMMDQMDSLQIWGERSLIVFRKQQYTGPYYFNTRLNLIAHYLYSSDYTIFTREALKILQEARAAKDTPYIARTLNMLGAVALANHEAGKAVEYSEQAVALARRTDDKLTLYQMLSDLAASYSEAKRYRDVISPAHEALQRQPRSVEADAYTYDHLADAHIGLGNDDSARYYLRKSYEASRTAGDETNLINLYSSYTTLYERGEHYTAALAAVDSGIAIMNRQHVTTLMPAFLNSRAKMLDKLGRYREALGAMTLSDSLKDAAYGAQTRAQISELETRYRTQEKEASILSLSKLNGQQRRWLTITVALLALALLAAGIAGYQYRRQQLANRTIRRQSEKLEWLMKEVHHRVKNNLQVITSLINMQLRREPDPETGRLLTDTISRVQSIALIHQKLYQSSEQERVSMQEYTDALAKALLALHGSAELDIKAPVSLDIDTAVLIGLVLTELITNSCKYARQPGRSLRLQIMITGNGSDYRLHYRDNGPGFSAPAQESTMGLRIVSLMTRQMSGRLRNRNEDGAVYDISFLDEGQRKKVA